MVSLKLIKEHRLYINSDIVHNLKEKLHSPYLQNHAQDVLHDADKLVRTKPIAEGQYSTYQHGTRQLDSYLMCLTAAWVLTKNEKYKKAIIKHLGTLLNWKQISCEANHTMSADLVLYFCLSYGELAATVGTLYDVLKSELNTSEKDVIFAVLDKFLMKAAVNCVDKAPWWANKIWSNWNGVCAGGMGILALAFYDEHPDAKKCIPFVEKSLGEYFKSYIENGGGCPEGTGYWNYGMNYSMRYLLSWENATNKKHPALKIKELGQSLNFPLDFTGISFGDNDGWHPGCFFFMLAKRMNKPNAAFNAAAYLDQNPKPQKKKILKGRATSGDLLYAADYMPTAEEIEQLKKSHQKTKEPRAYVYKDLEWGSIADDAAFPKLRLAIRGGSDEVTGHGMIDLLSFRCRVNGELMITDQQDGGYMATTFTRRGHEVYGRSVASKSSLFVDGLGCNIGVRCKKTEVVKGNGLLGIRVDGSNVFLPRWKEIFIGRLCLLVDNEFWLIVDQVTNPKNELDTHWLESRFHTLADNKGGKDWVSLKSGKESMQMTFASLNEGIIQESNGMPSQPLKQSKIYRWMSKSAYSDNMQVVAMNPGSKRLKVKVIKEKSNAYCIEVTKPGGKKRVVYLQSNLKLKK